MAETERPERGWDDERGTYGCPDGTNVVIWHKCSE